MHWDEFSDWGAKISQWAADYHKNLRDRPVRAQTAPGDVAALLEHSAPETPQSMEEIMADFERVVMPGMTHWQHPRFFAYFPANAAPPSMLAEMLVSTIAAQCMLWQTSPAATEMETVMLDWLRQAIGLPSGFSGVIQDSASSATLAAVLTMRERALNWQGNRSGLSGAPRLRIYCSAEVHTSVDRAIWVAGIGQDNLVRIPIGGIRRGMDPVALRAAIEADIAAGYLPAGVIACTGGTGTGACDDLTAVLGVAKEFNLYSHVDAAWAGAGMICPEFRALWAGIEGADSLVFNPHKWLGAQFDCSAHFLADPASLVKTLAIQPEYLKTHGRDGVINYSEWSLPLGRRFRALKLWFLLRSYGLEALRQRLRNHVAWAEGLADQLSQHPQFEIVTAPVLSLFTFRLAGCDDAAQIAFVNRINDDGRIYITQTQVDGQIAVRFQIGQFDVTQDDVQCAYQVLCELAA
ncbi:pyridoxal-dependent decarboxylase [Planktomarina temperata]|jgi:aromatic-L-amino-acid decarboxylase|uniref:pyridoxal phosphate-dependent decarboxylase family protein n=1 Tax=Planktomarina TaxID=1284657 RepID=UPI0023037FF3|nr:pyridoxal-dependent decarboxylase [Planktomarina temperata]MDA8999698.1 pyridoxal-dependent decarboxylase [bacterium]MDA7458424.1 pyridoxal-dependent decarboxylase [Planktomarina temperata]MDA8995565.1 pyridoxal-dependent decarboxylase [Planktomarina temperata]MDB2516084.1 pyridoxal-dependent decarboxylase [Planktomarina temperata]